MKPEKKLQKALIELYWEAFEAGRAAEFSKTPILSILRDKEITDNRVRAISKTIKIISGMMEAKK